VLASVAASRTHALTVAGHGHLDALTGGYHIAFLVGAGFALLAGVLGGTLLRPAQQPAEHQEAAPTAAPAVEHS
jgi:hypothetical protein